MKSKPGPDRPSPRADIVAMLARIGIPVIDPDRNGRSVLAQFSERCHLRIDDERQPDPRDRAGLCLVFLALDLPDAERRAHAMNLTEATRFAGMPSDLSPDLPGLKAAEGLLRSLAGPLGERLRQFDAAHPDTLLAALVENRFGPAGPNRSGGSRHRT